ncbi:22.0 kDa heat shock protein-like protein [Drosera capensis]
MANPRRQKRPGEEQGMDQERTYQEIVPSSGWTEDTKFHRLLIDLPDFRKDDIRLQVDKSGHLTVIGGRLLNRDKYMNFEKTFKLPENSDSAKISGEFEGDMLYIRIPKIMKDKIKESKNETATSSGYDEEEKEEFSDSSREGSDDENSDNEDDSRGKNSWRRPYEGEEPRNGSRNENHYHEQWKKKCLEKENLFKVVIETVNELKGIIATAVLAFTLGMLVSHKLQQVLPR